MRLDSALGQDVIAARAILAGKLGPVVLEEKDGAVWAQMEVGPALLFAAGAGFDSIQGCGGAQPDSEALTYQIVSRRDMADTRELPLSIRRLRDHDAERLGRPCGTYICQNRCA